VSASSEAAEVAPAWAPIAADGSTGTAGHPGDDEIDEVERRPRHPYTWLHLIVLALVAFVLGFLIMLLVVNGRDDTGAAGPAVTHVTSTSPPA
jgi:hypothetical protein